MGAPSLWGGFSSIAEQFHTTVLPSFPKRKLSPEGEQFGPGMHLHPAGGAGPPVSAMCHCEKLDQKACELQRLQRPQLIYPEGRECCARAPTHRVVPAVLEIPVRDQRGGHCSKI